MEKINFEAGTIVTPAKVNEDKTITPAVWEGTTPLSPFILNKLQDNIENDQIEQNTVIDELKTKTIKCLQEVETPTPVSGTSIDLSDSADAKITDLKISGNSKQETREGYNLLPNNATTMTKNGITFTVNEDKSITVNGTATAQTDLPLFGKYDNTSSTFKVNGTITYGLITNNDNVQIHLVKNGTQSLGFTNSSSTLILNEDTNINYVVLRVSTNSTISNQTFYPMIRSGSELGEYEQYGASPSPDYPSEVECCGDNGSINEVICNKNLCNLGNQIQNTNIGLTNNINKNIWKILGTSSGNEYVTKLGRISLGIFKAGTYYFSWKYTGTLSYVSGGNTSVSLLNKKNSTLLMNVSLNREEKYFKVTITEDTELAFGIWNTGSGNVYDIEIKCQLEQSETNTEIVEHKKQVYTIPTQQPFRAIGDIRDTFIKKNNKWYERHYISRKIFDGTETFKYSSGTSVIYTDVFTDRILGKVNFSCNCFKVENFSDYSIMTLNTATGDRTNNYRIIFKTEYTNADDFKAWITAQYNAGTPVYIDYILETPLDIECTEEQSTILFDIEENAKTYDKVTHIYSTDNVSSYKDVTYKKDIETLFANTLVEGV